MKLLSLLTLLPVAVALPATITVPRAGAPIPGRYIVKMKKQNFEKDIRNALKLLKKSPAHVYNFGSFGGFACEIADDTVQQLRYLPGVEHIEQDSIVKASLGEIHLAKKAYITQASSTWGLARISHQNPGGTSYAYDASAGSGTCVYVLDTGIATSHSEFEGRAQFLANFAGDGSNTDGHGHGTHCAGTIGSKTYGIAKRTMLYSVKVLNANASGFIAGINFVVNDVKTRSCPNGALMSSSLGGTRSIALNSASSNAVSVGIFMAVAAGNEAQDANNTSPASEPTVFTVGATDSSDRFAYFSNFGTVVDVLAPGVSIQSTWLNDGINIMSGTSMATPHVAGLAAYLLALEGRKTPAALSARIQSLSLRDKITGLPPGTKNYLAFNGNPSG